MGDKSNLSINAEDIGINEHGEVVIRNPDLARKLRDAAKPGLSKAALHNLACGNNYQCGKAVAEMPDEWLEAKSKV